MLAQAELIQVTMITHDLFGWIKALDVMRVQPFCCSALVRKMLRPSSGRGVELHVIQLDLPGFELGNVENFVDQGQQFIARAL